MSIKLEKKEYSVLESDPVTNICAVLTKNNSDCEVGFEFEVLLVIHATTQGMRNISAVIKLLLYNIFKNHMHVVRRVKNDMNVRHWEPDESCDIPYLHAIITICNICISSSSAVKSSCSYAP